MAQDVAILDFGSGKITVLIGKRGVNNTICISGIGESDYAGFSEGEFFEPDQLSSVIGHAISQAETNAGVKIEHLFVGVPGEFSSCICREVSLAFQKKRKVTEEDLDALHDQGNIYKKDLHYTLVNSQPIYYTLDSAQRLIQPVGLTSSRIGGLISYIFAENRFIDFIDGIMHESGIESFDYVSSVLAQVLYLFDAPVRDQFVVLADTGYITTTVVVARGDGLLAQYNFPLGGGHITGDLANHFNISFTQAESLKKKVNLSLNPSPEDVYSVSVNRTDTESFPAAIVNQIVTARITTIADTIKKCLKLCEYEYPDQIPYHITGGGLSYIKGARDYLSRHLAKTVEVITPRQPQFARPHLSCEFGLLDMVLSHGFATEKKRGLFSKLFGNAN